MLRHRLIRWWRDWRPGWRLPWRRKELSLGERGEQLAARYLRRLGYHIAAQRHRTTLGELDLVAIDGRTVVFVEVKTRRSDQAGEPHEAIDPQKQARISRLALAYLKRHDLLECRSRFDCIAITWPAGGVEPAVEHFQSAFESTL
jgi:putative endonuclease